MFWERLLSPFCSCQSYGGNIRFSSLSLWRVAGATMATARHAVRFHIHQQNTKPHLLPSTAVPFSSKEKFSTTRLRVACLGIIGWVFNGWIVFPRGACFPPPPPTMLMSEMNMFCWVDKHPTVSRLHRILCYWDGHFLHRHHGARTPRSFELLAWNWSSHQHVRGDDMGNTVVRLPSITCGGLSGCHDDLLLLPPDSKAHHEVRCVI